MEAIEQLKALARLSRNASKFTTKCPWISGDKYVSAAEDGKDGFKIILAAEEALNTAQERRANAGHVAHHSPERTRKTADLLDLLADLLPELRHGCNDETGNRCQYDALGASYPCTCGHDAFLARLDAILKS